MTIEKHSNKHYTFYDILKNGEWISRTYMDYTKQHALMKFREYKAEMYKNRFMRYLSKR